MGKVYDTAKPDTDQERELRKLELLLITVGADLLLKYYGKSGRLI